MNNLEKSQKNFVRFEIGQVTIFHMEDIFNNYGTP